MRVKIGSIAFLKAAASGYAIGLTNDGHRVEFLGDWSVLEDLQAELENDEVVYVEVADWQVVAYDDELRIPMTREGMAERAAFIRSALRNRD
jgi:hypothetical protein